MSLDERRAALIAATEPLLERFGRDVSTRQIADAAGIAEGTIFRAFATKEELIDAVIEMPTTFSAPATSSPRFDLSLNLEQRLVSAVEILQQRLRRLVRPVLVIATAQGCPDRDSFRAKQQVDNELLNSAIAALIQPEQDQLRLDPLEVASVLRAITFSVSHHLLGDQRLAEPRRIVDLVLYGVCRHSAQGEPTSC
jgi:AcrR family transcriptional regulator